MTSEYVPPTARDIALAHTRAIVRAAVLVSIRRQEQVAAEVDMAEQLGSLVGPDGQFRVIDSTRLMAATAAVDQAVDALTQACVEAQVAAEARNN